MSEEDQESNNRPIRVSGDLKKIHQASKEKFNSSDNEE